MGRGFFWGGPENGWKTKNKMWMNDWLSRCVVIQELCFIFILSNMLVWILKRRLCCVNQHVFVSKFRFFRSKVVESNLPFHWWNPKKKTSHPLWTFMYLCKSPTDQCKKPSLFGEYRGWKSTQLCGDYFYKAWNKDPVIKLLWHFYRFITDINGLYPSFCFCGSIGDTTSDPW